MYNYAQLNNEYYCIGFSTFNSKVESDYLVPLLNYDEALRFRRYDPNNKVWLDDYLIIPPRPPVDTTLTLEERVKELEAQLATLRDVTIKLMLT